MKKKIRIWAIVSAVWALFMLGMSFRDVKYGLEYHLFHGRVEAAHQARVAEYEQAKREGEDDIRAMLQAARRYDTLQFLALTEKRKHHPSSLSVSAQKERLQGPSRSEYQRTLDEIATLESAYGKAALRQYREQDEETAKKLIDDMEARLIVPRMREPRLAALLFYMTAMPLALLLALWIPELDYRRLATLRRTRKTRIAKE